MIGMFLFFAVAIGLPVGLWYLKKKHELTDEPIDGIDGLADTDMVCVPYRGEWLTMSKLEYLQLWIGASRKYKSDLLANQKKLLKSGHIQKHYFGDDGRYQILPTDKGNKFKTIHDIKQEAYREATKR